MKSMTANTVCLLLFLMLLLNSFVWADEIVGVQRGNWIKYQFNDVPVGVVSLKYDIQDVEGTNITVLVTYYWSNATVTTLEATVNITAWPWDKKEFGLVAPAMIPANASAGESFPVWIHPVNITGETTGTFAGVNRTIILGTQAPYTWYWDKKTGVCMELRADLENKPWNITVTDTNLFTGVTLDWRPLAVLGIGIVAVAALVILASRRKKTPTLATREDKNQSETPEKSAQRTM